MAVSQSTLEIVIRAKDAASKALSGLNAKLQNTKRRLETMRGPALAIVGLFGGIAGASIKFASDLEEASARSDAVFKGSVDIVREFANETADAYNITRAEANEYASTLGAILNASGLTTESSATMSVELTKLAADMSSAANIPLDEALQKIRSGLVGEAEPLRTVGVLLSAAAVEQEAYRQGIAEVGDELTEGQKVQARYSLILSQTTDMQGDVARTSGSFANQMRDLRQTVQDAGAEIGTKLIPVATQLIGWLVSGVKWFGNLSDRAKTIILVVGGITAGLAALILVLPPLIAGITALGVVFNLALSPVTLIIVGVGLAIAGLIAAGVALIKNWDHIRGAARTVFVFIAEQVLQPFIDFYTEVIGRILDGIAGVVNAAEALANFLGLEWKQSISDTLNEVSKNMRNFQLDGDEIFSAAEAGVKGFVEGADEQIGKLRDLFTGLTDVQAGATEEWVANEREAASDVIKAQEAVAKAKGQADTSRFDALLRQVQGLPAVIGQGTTGGPGSEFASIRQSAAEAGGIMDAFGNPIVPGHPLYERVFGALGVNAGLPTLPGAEPGTDPGVGGEGEDTEFEVSERIRGGTVNVNVNIDGRQVSQAEADVMVDEGVTP